MFISSQTNQISDPRENDEEPLLKFGETYFGFLCVFETDLPAGSEESVIDMLGEKGFTANYSDGFTEHFETAESFLFPETLAQNRIRLQINGFTISSPDIPENSILSEPIYVESYLTLFTGLNIATLLFNVRLDSCTTDDIIFLKHVFGGKRFPFQVELDIFSSTITLKTHLNDIINNYIKKVRNSLNKSDSTGLVFTDLVEIRKIANLHISNPSELCEITPKQVYGLLSNDEGWRFVPLKAATSEQIRVWGTRDFLSVITFNDSLLFLNLSKDKRSQDYVNSQSSLRIAYGQEPEKYFTFEPQIAGLNHGPLLILENATIMRLLLDKMLKPKKDLKHIKAFLIERDTIVDTLNKLSAINLREISKMSDNVKHSLLIDRDILALKERLADLQGSLMFKYTERINLSIIALTILSIIIAVISLVSTIVK